ncbi:MAG: Fic family protein [Gemmatimonadota bacterium]|nr:Fic family protein [Gemmatimonadota bacterium]
MRRSLQGQYIHNAGGGEPFKAFVPAPLPPHPPVEWTPPLRARFDAALVALGRLDAVTELLPDTGLLLSSFVRKEAVLSSMIEGTKSTLADLFLVETDETPTAPLHDVREVRRHVAALEHGFKRLRGGFPLSLRLLREIHAVLFKASRNRSVTPGEFRRSQVWVGGTRPGNAVFVPPPAGAVPDCLSSLERFLNDLPEPHSPLVKAALVHVQFETIHPFLDGNGRVGRLLIPLQLAADGVLREPLLFVSLHFKQHRQTYYELLNRVRTEGDWESWLEFFSVAVAESATAAVNAARRLLKLTARDAASIAGLGRPAPSALLIHRALQRHPIATAEKLGALAHLTPATVNRALVHLERLGIVSELTAKQRGRVFSYVQYTRILNEGMALPR